MSRSGRRCSACPVASSRLHRESLPLFPRVLRVDGALLAGAVTVRAEQVGVLDGEVVALGALGEHGHPMNSLHPHLHSPVSKAW